MRKIAVLAATAAVIAAASGLWSTATFDKPKVAGHVQATEAPPVSPHEIMVKQGQNPPGRILGRSVLSLERKQVAYLGASARSAAGLQPLTPPMVRPAVMRRRNA